MALTRPTLLAVPAFDATNNQTFVFNVVGGSQVVANQLVIRNNLTNEIVYTEKQEAFKYEHIVNANELTNGVYYNAVISTFDAEGNESQVSSPIQFYCFATPSLELTNMPTGNIIPNASYGFEFTYSQAENEQLNSYVVNLYNSFQSLLSTSGAVYTNSTAVPYVGSYLFAGLEDNTVYYIEVTGTTVNNTVVTTGLVQITVSYTQPDLFTLMELTNNCDEGYVTVKSNIIAIDGSSVPSPPTYINNEEVDLTAEGSSVTFNEGFSIPADFVGRAWFRNPNVNSTILQFSNAEGQTITINIRQGYEYATDTEQKIYAEVIVNSVPLVNYYIYSNYVAIQEESSYYNLWLTRLNHIYQIQLLVG